MKWLVLGIFGLSCAGGGLFFAIAKGLPESTEVQAVLTSRHVRTICSPVSAEVVWVYARSGQRVRAGERLFSLDTRESYRKLGSMEIQLSQLRSRGKGLSNALARGGTTASLEIEALKSDLESALRAGEGISPREVLRRQSLIKLTQTQWTGNLAEIYQSLEANLFQITQLEWERDVLSAKLRECNVVSPGDGFITSVVPGDPKSKLPELFPGMVLAEGQPAIFWEDPQAMDLIVRLPNTVIKRIQLLDPVVVKIGKVLNKGKERTFKEKILEIREPEGTGDFLIKMSWSGEVEDLPPGIILNVRIPLLPLENSL